MKLSVIIINYRTADLTIECLKSLLGEINIGDTGVVVVDNNSGDGSVQVLRKWLKAHDTDNLVTLMASPENTGFSGGNNLGIRASEAEYYLLLNNDTVVGKGAIKTLLKTAETHKQAGIVSPKLISLDSEPQVSCFRFPTPISEFVKAVSTGIITKIFARYVVAIQTRNEISHPEWTSFACVLVRGKLFREVGLLDDGFFMYYEDVEFCHRARKSGWDIVHTPFAEIVHLHGQSSGVEEKVQSQKRLPKYYYAARARCFYLLYGHPGLIAANLLWSLGRAGSKIRGFFERRHRPLPDRQWLDIWTNWLRPDAPKSETAPR